MIIYSEDLSSLCREHSKRYRKLIFQRCINTKCINTVLIQAKPVRVTEVETSELLPLSFANQSDKFDK